MSADLFAVRSMLFLPASNARAIEKARTLAADLVDTMRALDGLLGVLVRQVAGYADGRELYDDADADPLERLQDSERHLTVARQRLAEAERAANGFWSAIGHIGERS